MHTVLNGIIIFSDCGYWTAPLILLILSLGGIVFGTLKWHFGYLILMTKRIPVGEIRSKANTDGVASWLSLGGR